MHINDVGNDRSQRIIKEIVRIVTLCLPCAFILPVKITSFLIIVLCAIWIYLSIRAGDGFALRFKSNICGTLFLIYFGLQALSLLYSKDLAFGLKNIEVKLPFLIFPVILFSGYDILEGIGVKKLLFIFSQSIFLVCAYSLLRIILGGNTFWENWNQYTFVSLSGLIDVHPGYFSLYIGFSILILLIQFRMRSTRTKILMIAEILIFILFVFRLASRMPMVGLVLCLVLYIILEKQFKLMFIAILMVVLIFLFAGNSPDIRERFLIPIELVASGNFEGLKRYIFDRHQIYSCAVDVLSNNSLLTGVGTGDANHALIACYDENGFEWVSSRRYNAHNEFLQSTLETGIFGGLIFLFLIVFPIRFWRSQKEFMLLSLLFGVFSLTESTLQVHKGVVFFSFFYLLFAYYVVKFQNSIK